MDGDPVEGEPSKESASLASTLIAICPDYIAMGMSYHDYWHLPTTAHKAYREAYKKNRRNEEWARHRQGAYFMQALAVALQGFNKDKSHKDSYPLEPWPLTDIEAEQRQAEKEREGYEKALAQRRAEIARRKEKEAIESGEH